MPLPPGVRLGAYEVVSLIGAGGMSACGHAEPRTSDSEVRHQREVRVGVGLHAK